MVCGKVGNPEDDRPCLQSLLESAFMSAATMWYGLAVSAVPAALSSLHQNLQEVTMHCRVCQTLALRFEPFAEQPQTSCRIPRHYSASILHDASERIYSCLMCLQHFRDTTFNYKISRIAYLSSIIALHVAHVNWYNHLPQGQNMSAMLNCLALQDQLQR